MFVYKTKWINETYTLGYVSKIKAKEDKFSHWDKHDIREAKDGKKQKVRVNAESNSMCIFTNHGSAILFENWPA